MDRAPRRRRLQDRTSAADLHRPNRNRLHAGRPALSNAGAHSGQPLWVDGRLIEARDALATRVAPGRPGCQTTARVRGGEADFAARHVARLQRDAALIGSEPPDADRILDAFSVLGRTVFGEAEGVIRLELRPDEVGRSMLIARARPLGADAPIWRGTLAPIVHPGGGVHPGVKHTEHPVWTRGRAHATELGLDEALLCNERRQLVEGARSALIVVLGDGTLAYPDPALGAVASIGLAVLREHAGGLEPRCIPLGALLEAREVIAVNAVRGVRPIVAIDGTDVGEGRAGPAARRLGAAFDAAVQEESRSAR